MTRFLRNDIHPQNPQLRMLQHAATHVRAGAVLALPTAAGYGLACRMDDKATADRLRRCAAADERALAALLYRDLAQAAGYLHIDDHAFRTIRAAGDGSEAFVLRGTRRLPRRLTNPAGGLSLLQFAGHAVAQGLLELLDEPLLLVLPTPPAACVEEMPAHWRLTVDVALDAGLLDMAGPLRWVDLGGLLQARPSVARRAGVVPAFA
jgi:tRNA A37 threonylcarbamoyladenosine synthetase subunit TsaC/SUA5/YrdC